MKAQIALNLLTAVSAIVVPSKSGPYSVGTKIVALTDTSRMDPYAPANEPQHRRVLLTFYLPVDQRENCPTEVVPYMPPAVKAAYNQYAVDHGLPNNTFDPWELEFCNLDKLKGCNKKRSFPVITFSPGLSNSRLIYGGMEASLASQGYIVVSMDHPYDGLMVEFPDGTTVPPATIDDSDPAQLTKALEVRAADISFVVRQLRNHTLIHPLLKNYPGRMDLSRLVAHGHSLGGMASIAAARTDKAILGAVDLDGQFVEPIQSQEISKPTLLFGHEGHDLGDPTWDQAWPHITGKKIQLSINGTTHGSFEDLLRLMAQLDLPDAVREALKQEIGSISWQDMDRDVNGGLMAFFDLVFNGKSSPLTGINSRYPNITVTRTNLN
ncbi:hypothetical protein VHEMI04710 [[Torrubiella] hemipterigena]|uniref:1-alkyl-2-acetylglycerophosphocholine esterase n=1 Tax=[Torrubiella] hemipterigena TaxID=1531966 RepID=A0A0A1TEM2_9HYPO|nr:hypothetical protein VHEMI04710 [[Torrubiella] hemipterigena]